MSSFLYRNLRAAAKGFYWFVCLLFLAAPKVFAQVDQGTITGVVQDSAGAVIPGAQVTLTDTDTGFVLQRKTNDHGIYIFSPIKIDHYSVSATAPGFDTTSQENLHLDIQERLNIVLTLKPGSVSQTVMVSSAPPLLQTQEGSVGQVISASTINDTPLNGRNWVYIAQLTAGVALPFGDTRGSGTGDFVANGQSAEQNNFILDGVDNNTNLVDFLNGSSYLQRPPPDALAEFKIQTSNYSAEFGHSAGAVVNASIKSGTNHIHGDMWEYFRNTVLDAQNWNSPTSAPYHENQFGATLGLPILKNKLFFFGDAEANRIAIAGTDIVTTPTPLMRQGNFSELLNPSLTTEPEAVYLYAPNSGGNTDKTGQSTVNRQSCNGQANVLCPGQIDPVAQNILNLYPLPNANGGKTYDNYVFNNPSENDTWQWDQRVDWNISKKDQAYSRYSYLHVIGYSAPPLGNILDGSTYGAGQTRNLAENFMLSETHIFNSKFTNEFRFGYNWDSVGFLQSNANKDVSLELGLGGVPFSPGLGGLPQVTVSGINTWGSPAISVETQNVYQILDNVTKILGNHSLKLGVSLQALRVSYLYTQTPRGSYVYSGTYTKSIAASIPTGSGIADFLVNQMNSAGITVAPNADDEDWYRSGYLQDDWRVTTRLTLNLGMRYDYYQPYKELAGNQANFHVTSSGIGTGSAVYQIVSKAQNVSLGAVFPQLMAQNNVTIQYVNNERLRASQKTNFAPRIGFAYQPDPKSVISGGFGIFYGGLQSEGNENLGANFPFALTASIPAPSCSYGNCPSIGVTLENGLTKQLANGVQSFVSFPAVTGTVPLIQTPYTETYNLSVQHAFSNNLVATLSYVGNVGRHVEDGQEQNTAPVIIKTGQSILPYEPFPTLGLAHQLLYTGVSTYNSLQAKLEKRYSNGLSFLATYTWGHAMSDAPDAGALQTEISPRQFALIPFIDEFANSNYDVRQRFTLNGNYQLPFGHGRAYLNHSSRWADLVAGGWSTSFTFAAQTGTPFTVTPNTPAPVGGSARALLAGDPFAPGGSPNTTNPTITCSAATRNKTHWYNPCAFANPLGGNLITTPVTTAATALEYLGGKNNQIYGPGYNRVNMSLFKSFVTFHEQYLQFRADAFNLFNHPSLASPSLTGVNSTAGEIVGPKTFQNDTPDARFFQLSLKYVF